LQSGAAWGIILTWRGGHVARRKSKGRQMGSKITFRRNHPGGGPLGRCSYGIAGVPGIVVIDLGLFPGGIAPVAITLDCTLVEAKAKAVKADAAPATPAAPAAPAAEGMVTKVKGKLVASKPHAAKVG